MVSIGSHRAIKALPPRAFFLRQLVRSFLVATGVIGTCLGLGVAGYHYLGGLGWIDALLNASMILTGMGPVDPMSTVGGKLFASAYALFSGVAFITTIGLLLAPVVQRFLHRFHLELPVEEGDPPDGSRGT
ncbi:MAG TPA: hypothetical protein VGK94_12080 [Candidatus Polarisedimenticolia bacterium]|jgi:hypothetical protein